MNSHTYRDLKLLGHTNNEIRSRAQDGRWPQLRRGGYLTTPTASPKNDIAH